MPAKHFTAEAVIAACERDDYTDFCHACGEEQCGVEDDARGYRCESCGARAVYGAGETLLTGV